MSDPSARARSSWPVALVITLLLCAGLIVALRSMNKSDDPTPAASPTKVDLSSLPFSSTDTRIPGAPHDKAQSLAPDGTVVHPRKVTALFTKPGGRAFAKIKPTQFGDTWLPVVAQAGNWVQVLLPSRPDGSTGWMQNSRLDHAKTSYQIQVHLASRQLQLFDGTTLVGSWSVAVGASGTPTPTGRTFLLGQVVDDGQSYSPVILPLGTHSATLDSYGGGPGTVAIHGWPDASVFGQAVSHGCIRVPSDALERLSTIPLGTAVLITNT
ncbi:MAG TPA: L,D-transpeptidase [Nocardioides sp.]|nr:L,D-transpeptidase [Nocardioides sp.]